MEPVVTGIEGVGFGGRADKPHGELRMKLRMRGDSLRLRLGPAELARLIETGRVEETVHLGPSVKDRFTYSLEHDTQSASISTRYSDGELVVVLPTELARAWASGIETGVYGGIETGSSTLEIAVEKDWACLDKGDAENEDTFPNPKQGAVC